ncbi:MAG: flagellar M-ring protein FliF [Rhodospirillales bacterium]|nr:flagellar M-ring protein FliF [Rhodospirillales bacterium]MCB9973206.1 flagellar M-ring protein FliF [Rhodospirillales bacterium]MCB9979534.1 flagellar M-ring protein FliF [Rhodospirillales bacterium]
MNSFYETLRKLGPARIAVMGAIVLGLLVFFVFVSLRVSTPSLKLLYSDLSTTDSAAIAAKLETEGIRYNVSEDGQQVRVPANEIGRARMLLAEAGLPNGGSLGYELFDQQSGFGTTNFVQNINQVRALEGELSRTISSLGPIRSARVHIVLPQRELFSRDNTKARASVVLSVEPGNRLDRKQANAIQFLVASSIPDLKVSNVSVLDQDGTLLARGEEDEGGLFDNRSEELRRGTENRMRQNIEEIVGKIVGFGKVRATVTADLNFDRITTNEEIYDPNTVVRSTQVTEENSQERDASKNEVGVQNNLPGGTNNLLVDQQPTAQNNRLEEVTNYEVSRTVRNRVSEVGEIRKLSVAVLVDGRYVTQTDADGVETQTYEPRAQEELDQIKSLVRSAVGLDEGRGDTLEVVNLQFAGIDDASTLDDGKILGFEPSEIKDLVEVIIVTIAIVLVVLLVLRPMIGRILEVQDSGGGAERADMEMDLLAIKPEHPALEGPSQSLDMDDRGPSSGRPDDMIDMTQVEGKVKASSLKKVEDIVDAYPAETVSVLRSWMTQES